MLLLTTMVLMLSGPTGMCTDLFLLKSCLPPTYCGLFAWCFQGKELFLAILIKLLITFCYN